MSKISLKPTKPYSPYIRTAWVPSVAYIPGSHSLVCLWKETELGGFFALRVTWNKHTLVGKCLLKKTHVCWICWKPMIVGITCWRSNLGSYKQYGRDSLFMHVIFTTSHCECSNHQDQKCTSLIPILGGGMGMRLRVQCLKSHCECSNKHGVLTV